MHAGTEGEMLLVAGLYDQWQRLDVSANAQQSDLFKGLAAYVQCKNWLRVGVSFLKLILFQLGISFLVSGLSIDLSQSSHYKISGHPTRLAAPPLPLPSQRPGTNRSLA